MTLTSVDDVEKSEPLRTAGGHISDATALGNSVMAPHTFNPEPPHDPATLLLGVNLGQLMTHVHIEACAQMFRAALFTVAKK